MSENNNNNLGLEGILQGVVNKGRSVNNTPVREPINASSAFNNSNNSRVAENNIVSEIIPNSEPIKKAEPQQELIVESVKKDTSENTKESENITITFTLNRKYLAILKHHFEDEGIVKQSTFIRAIIIRFMKSHGLIT